MEWKLLITVFASVFVAELADKTQLVTLLFASDRGASKLTVFLGASLALISASAIAVAAGTLLSQLISVRTMSMVAGAGFILIGAWILFNVHSSG